jgi:hypothetical protein
MPNQFVAKSLEGIRSVGKIPLVDTLPINQFRTTVAAGPGHRQALCSPLPFETVQIAVTIRIRALNSERFEA